MSMITLKTISTISPTIACLALAIRAAAILLIGTRPALATDAKSKTPLTNVNVFDGKSDKLINNANVLAEGNLIKEVSTEKIPADGATVIDVGGRTLIPGLIDTHVQLEINCQYCGLEPFPLPGKRQGGNKRT